jgi:hypothetical protein
MIATNSWFLRTGPVETGRSIDRSDEQAAHNPPLDRCALVKVVQTWK